MSGSQAFVAGDTVSVVGGATSQRVPLAKGPSQRLFNAGTALAFLRFGDAAVTATAADMPLPAGALEIQTIQATHMAVIVPGGSAPIYATGGEGI